MEYIALPFPFGYTTGMAHKPRPRRKRKWRNWNYVLVYELAKTGMTKAKIAKVLGVAIGNFYNWYHARPTLRKAYKQGRRASKSHETFRGYAYRRLSPKLQKIWDKINAADARVAGTEKIERILEDAGKRARQHLFIYAWVAGNFNPTEACRVLCMDRQTYEGWYRDDPEFHELFDAMNQVKKDFFEAPLVAKVAEGDISAILFANRTYNADRGYGNKLQVSLNGKVDVNHKVVQVRDLHLETDLKRALLKAIRERNEAVAKLEHREQATNGKANGHTPR